MKRLFAAIKVLPSEEFTSLYYTLRSKLRHERIRWVPLENLHITLKFFGETEQDRIPLISEALKAAAETNQVFDFDLQDTGIFGSVYKPRVIWIRINRDERLLKLAGTVFEELDAKGWDQEKRNFVSHLTIARMNELRDRQLFQSIINEFAWEHKQTVSVKDFHLFESILTREGPIYQVVESFKLHPGSPK